jgi:diacylglycerol O-acyltransferase 1
MSASSSISLEEQAGTLLGQMKQNSIKEADTIEQLEVLVRQMQTQLGGVNELLKQNAAMEEVITDLSSELEEATTGILKRGHLFKWREHSISFASKWGLRYITLQGHTLSYFNDERDRHPRKTIDLINCFILDEGLTKNKQHHIFSICSTALSEDNRGPSGGALLRLSSDNAAEAVQWIHMLEKACGFTYPDRAVHQSIPVNGLSITTPILTRVKSSEAILNSVSAKKSSSPRQRSGRNFAPLNSSPSKKGGQKGIATVQHQDIIRKLKKKVHVTSFPASKNMHISPKDSPLSSSATKQNYRGFFNLGVIILLISHFHLIVDNLANHGFRFSSFFDYSVEKQHIYVWDVPRPLLVLLSWVVIVGMTYGIEKLAQNGKLSDRVTMVIQGALSTVNIIASALWVWHSNSHSGLSMLYLLQSVVIWMKMISYAHCNRDVRIAHKHNTSGHRQESDADNLHAEVQGIEGPVVTFPHNLTVSNLLYFCVAPTLCYQLNYPRSPTVRWTVVVTLVLRLLMTLGLIFFVVEQHMKPSLEAAMLPMKQFDIAAVLFGFLQLTIPSTYVWLLGFYLFFHLWLNLLAELTRFGDREFYLDWWNARTIDEYWRTWNLPVHHWMIRHLYYPSIRLGVSKKYAVYLAFFFSAVMHEFIISIPFQRISFHAFLGMLLQAPLVPITRKLNALFNNPSIGNIFFWMTFCIIGQPIGIIMYYYESWDMASSASSSAEVVL